MKETQTVALTGQINATNFTQSKALLVLVKNTRELFQQPVEMAA